MPDFADPEWFEKETRKRAIERDANDALRELHLQGKFDNEPAAFILTPADELFLASYGIALKDKERTGVIYHDLPVATLKPIRRYDTILTRGALLADLTADLERDEHAQPSARYARTLITEAYCDVPVEQVPSGKFQEIQAALDDLAARGSDEPIPAQYFYDLWLRVCPDGPRVCGIVKMQREHFMRGGWGC